jgi:3-hydroxybutyryl-CoA dehydrogenase
MKRRVEHVAVLGGGTMGLGICQIFALAGIETRLLSSSPSRTAIALEELVKRTMIQVGAGLRPHQALHAIRRVRQADEVTEAVHDADVVLETVPESLDLKVSVLDQASRAMSEGAILGTNTSSLPIGRLAEAVTGKQRFVGVHWFNPPEWIPGVEVIPCSHTSEETVRGIVDLLEQLGKAPVVVSDSPGFVASRLQAALFAEALKCVEEGVASPTQVDEAVRNSFGFRLPFFGPFEIADMAGLDVYAAVYDTLERELGPRFARPAILKEMVDQGRVGMKSGGGFHVYDPAVIEELVSRRDRLYAALGEVLRREHRS